MVDNDTLIKQMGRVKNLSERSVTEDLYALNMYSNFQKLSLEELIKEADKDEENIVKTRNRKIKKRLSDFVDFLQYNEHKHHKGVGYSPRTIHGLMNRVKAFYHYYEVDVPKVYLPIIPSNERSTDIPTMEDVKYVLDNISYIKHKALIRFMVSSGLSGWDTSELTKEDFRIASYEYHKKDNLKDALKELQTLIDNNEAIIPTWELTRSKTNYSFITFNSPEATKDMVQYLLTEADLNDTRLFELGVGSLRRIYIRIGKKLDMGKTSDGHNKFHSHAMRKTFATTLSNAELNGLPVNTMYIEFFLGHRLPAAMEPYYKNKPKRAKKIYTAIVDELSTDKINILDIKSPEYLELKQEKEDLENNLEESVQKNIKRILMENGLL